MSSSLPDGFDVRFATDADAAAVAELARAVEDAVLGVSVITEGDIRDWWRVTEPGENVWLIHGGGRLLGAATLWPRGEAPNVWGDVHPAALGRGLGTALLELAEGRASELGAAAVRNDVFAQDEIAVTLLEGRGYRPVRRYYEMRIMLGDEAPPEPEWPEGLTVAPFRDGDGPAFHAASSPRRSGTSGAAHRWSTRSGGERELEADDFELGDLVARSGRRRGRGRGWRCDAFRYGGGWVAGLGVVEAMAQARDRARTSSAHVSRLPRSWRAQHRPRRRLGEPDRSDAPLRACGDARRARDRSRSRRRLT